MRRIYRVLLLAVLLSLTLGVSATRNVSPDNLHLVTFDVSVTDKNGDPVVGLEARNFRIFEDNIEQPIKDVVRNQKPVALVVLVEYSEAFGYHAADVADPLAGLTKSLDPRDWMALVTFDAYPVIVTDFTREKTDVLTAVRRLVMPDRQESMLYDSIYFVLDRMDSLEQKKVILLFGTGLDNISYRRSLNDVVRKAQVSDTAIFTVGLEPPIPTMPESMAEFGARARLSDAENTMRWLAEATGGMSFVTQFAGQYRGIEPAIAKDLHNQYTLSFLSSKTAAPGKVRKLKVEIIDTDVDHNGKPDKLIVRHKAGY